ncbi:glycosyltransferase [Lysobacter olei]
MGVAGYDLKFWKPLENALAETGRFEFRHDVWSGHDRTDHRGAGELLGWADVLVAEWALGNSVYYSHNKRPGQRLIVRMHQQERHTEFLNHINYGKVDQVLFVGRHILEDCVKRFPVPREKARVLGNFVDTKRFDLTKVGGNEFTLGMIGIAPQLKGLDRAIDLLEVLVDRDERYRLRIKGDSPASIPWLWGRTAERQYYEAVFDRINSGPLRYHVNFDPPGKDVEHWLKYVGYLLSPSTMESFHMALAEGAASGAVPVLWKREGVESIFPEFEPLDSSTAAADWIEFHNRSAAGIRMRSIAKKAMHRRYCREEIVGRWAALLETENRNAYGNLIPAVKGRKVLVVWAIDDWSIFHRAEMLSALQENLGDEWHMVVIEPGNHFGAIIQKGWAEEAELKRIAAGELLPVTHNISRTRLLTGGVPADILGASGIVHSNELEVLKQILDRNFAQATQPVHWIYKPDQAGRLGAAPYVYEIYDDYTMDFSTGAPLPGIAEMEKAAIDGARHVFFTSEPLQARKSSARTPASLVGNGVDYPVFAKYRVERSARVGRPVAGYLGNLSDFFDWQLMHDVCSRMAHVDFVFHGQVETHRLGRRETLYHAMRAMPNVRFSGRVNRVLGASSIARYDVLLIPFVVNDAMDAVNPLKLWEYLATGLPVVSTPMVAVNEEEPLVITAHGADAWVAGIDRAVAPEFNCGDSVQARISRAEAHSWDRLTRTHANVLKALQ